MGFCGRLDSGLLIPHGVGTSAYPGRCLWMAEYLSLTSWFKDLFQCCPFILGTLHLPCQELSVSLNENGKTSTGTCVPLDRLTYHMLYL